MNTDIIPSLVACTDTGTDTGTDPGAGSRDVFLLGGGSSETNKQTTTTFASLAVASVDMSHLSDQWLKWDHSTGWLADWLVVLQINHHRDGEILSAFISLSLFH